MEPIKTIQEMDLGLLIHQSTRAGHLGNVTWLLEQGVPVDSLDEEGLSPLYRAAERGNIDIMQILKKNGARTDLIKDLSGNSILHYAVKANNMVAVNNLLSIGANVNCKNGESHTPLFVAALNGNANMMKYLMSRGGNIEEVDISGERPLHQAVEVNKLTAVELLLGAGADVNSLTEDEHEWSALHIAALRGRNEIVEVLLNNKADINLTDQGENESTPLLWAAYSGHVDTVRLLLKRGANRNAIGGRGDFKWPALHWAAYGDRLGVVRLLVEEYEADIHQMDTLGRTARQIAEGREKMAVAVWLENCELKKSYMD